MTNVRLGDQFSAMTTVWVLYEQHWSGGSVALEVFDWFFGPDACHYSFCVSRSANVSPQGLVRLRVMQVSVPKARDDYRGISEWLQGHVAEMDLTWPAHYVANVVRRGGG